MVKNRIGLLQKRRLNNMKVYIVCDHTEDTIDMIDKIFDTKRKAYDYVINKYYSSPFYKGMNPDWLDHNARPHVVEKEVE